MTGFKGIGVILCCLLLPILASWRQDGDDDTTRFLIGTGIYDVTGPAGQVNMMGYAKPEQTTAGIHQRLRARAFIFAKEASSAIVRQGTPSSSPHWIIPIDPQQHQHQKQHRGRAWERWMMFWDRSRKSGLRAKYSEGPKYFANATETVCFVSIDTGMGSDLLNIRVLERLKTLLPEDAQGLCTIERLSISGTHTHR